MTAGIFGLVGVLIGGALTVMTTELADRRRRQISARTAARLVGDDMTQVVAVIQVALDRGTWSSLATFDRGHRAWDERSDALAAAIELKDWMQLSQSIGVLGIVKEVAAAKTPSDPVDAASRERMERALDTVASALEILERIAK